MGTHVFAQLNGPVRCFLKILVEHHLRLTAEQILEHMPADVGLAEAAVVEPAQPALNLVAVQWQGRREMSQQAFDRLTGNFPDAEEAQDMVDA